MSGGTSFTTDFESLTLDNYLQLQVQDQIFTEHNLLGWIERNGVDRVTGGDNILIPVGTAEDAAGGSYSGYDTFDTTPSETITNAVATWKQYQQPIVANFFEIARNARTPEGKVNMWTAKADIALRSLRSKLNTHAFAASVGNSGKNIQGIGLLVDSAGTVEGINRTTATYWQANETAVSGALSIDTSTGMLRMFTSCSTGSGDSSSPTMIVTDRDEYEAYENILAPDIRFTSRSKGDGSFSDLSYKGVPLMWDSDCTAGVMFFLNGKTLKFYVHPDRNFKTTEIAKADNGTLNQDAWVSNILVYPELVILEPRRNGKLTGLTD